MEICFKVGIMEAKSMLHVETVGMNGASNKT